MKTTLSVSVDPAAFMRATKTRVHSLRIRNDKEALKSHEESGIPEWMFRLDENVQLTSTYSDEGCWTGRMIATDVAIQAMPSEYRMAISKPEHVTLVADWRSMHPWILAMASGDTTLRTALESGDLYADVANGSADIQRTCSGDAQAARKLAKRAVLGWLNGEGDAARRAAGCGDVASRLAALYPVAYQYLADVVKTGRAVYPGGVWEAPLTDTHGEAIASYKRPAGFLQGLEVTALHIARAALPTPAILMHDALVLFASEAEAPALADVLLGVMACALLEAVNGNVSIQDMQYAGRMVEVKGGKSWGEAVADRSIWKAAAARPSTLYGYAQDAKGKCLSRSMNLDREGEFDLGLMFGVMQWRRMDPEGWKRWREMVDLDGSSIERKQAKMLEARTNAMTAALTSWQRRNDASLLPSQDDVDVARWLVNSHKTDWLLHDDGTLYTLNEKSMLWTRDDSGHILRHALHGLDKKEDWSGERYTVIAATLPSLIEAVHTEMKANGMRWSASEPGLVAFEDTVWTETGLRDRKPSDHILVDDVVPQRYLDAFDAQGQRKEPVRFLAWLRDRLSDEEDATILFLQEFLGASRMGIAARCQRHVIFTGPGATGKSTFINVVCEAVFRKGARSLVQFKDACRAESRQDLATSLLNVCSDAPASDLEESGDLKAILVGEEVSVRSLYKNATRTKPRAGWMVACNSLPRVANGSAFWRRFEIVEFLKVIDAADRDANLEDMLLEEGAQIAAWVLEGGRRVKASGKYTVIARASSIAIREEMDRAGNPLLAWKDEQTNVTSGIHNSKGSDLYGDYREWCELNGHKAVSSTMFGIRLKELPGVEQKKKNIGTFYNIELKSAPASTPQPAFFSRNTDVH